MPCYHPLTAYRSAQGDVVFVERGDIVATLQLPCGRCIGCRLERSRQWAVRILHETKCHRENCFLTLTYDEEHCPRNLSLDYSEFQRFMKRLRKKFRGKRIRFYMCGEYGERFSRPHFHVCIFGLDFEDKVLFSSSGGNKLWTSATLDALWPFGFSSIGEVTFESAAYVARYCLKKVNGDLAKDHYSLVDLETGEVYEKTPEFAHMSLKPGIGALWLEKFESDVYPRDYVVVRGHESKPPRYYDSRFKKVNPDKFEEICFKRELDARNRLDNNTPARLAVREEVAKARSNLKKRSLA